MYVNVLISDAFNQFHSGYLTMKNMSSKTAESYAVCATLLIRKYGNVDICELNYKNIIDWYEWLLGWQSRDTAKNNISCLRMVLKYLRSRGLEVANYEEIPVPRREKRTIKYLTEDEMREFINEVGMPQRGYSAMNRLRNVAIVELLYATGLRNGELCALNRDSIQERTFTVVGKSKNPHIAFIDARTEEILNHYLSLRSDSNPALFISHTTGKRINSAGLREIFRAVCSRSETFKRIHPHTIRHSFATKMLHHEVDLRYIGDLMGHADLNTTRLYTHYSNPQLKKIYDTVHNILT